MLQGGTAIGEETSRQMFFVIPADGGVADEGLPQRVCSGEGVGHRPQQLSAVAASNRRQKPGGIAFCNAAISHA